MTIFKWISYLVLLLIICGAGIALDKWRIRRICSELIDEKFTPELR